MRITFVLPVVNLSGGIRVLSIYADGLRRRGHQVFVVSVRLPRATWKDTIRSVLRGHGWPRGSAKAPSHFDGLPLEHRRLPHAGPVTDADVPDADVVIGTWWETVRWVAALSPARGAKAHFVQGYDSHGGRSAEIDATYALPIPKIVISNWLRDLLQTRFGRTPVAVIPNSVETDKFHAPPRGKQAVPTVGMIYALERIKGSDICIQAYELACKEVPNLHLKAMGTYQLDAKLPLPASAEFVYGARDQKLRDVYAGCDAWLFGSRQEGFGLPILEAMACRTPVIAAPGGAAPELIARGGGLLVPAEDPPAMARAIVQVCSLSDGEWRQLSDAALANATGYTWEDAIERFEQALGQVVATSAV